MSTEHEIPPEYRGWWHIIEASRWWSGKDFERPAPALISFNGYDDRLQIFVLIACITCKATKSGVSFTWKGAWEFDEMSGSGRVSLRKDGLLKGVIKISGGEEGTFVAERADAPEEPIPAPPSYRDKWRRRW